MSEETQRADGAEDAVSYLLQSTGQFIAGANKQARRARARAAGIPHTLLDAGSAFPAFSTRAQVL